MRLLSTSLLTFIATIMLIAQDAAVAAEPLRQMAERWGLWAAATIGLVMYVIYKQHQQSQFIENTMVGLIKDNQRCIQANTSALQNAPCGRKDNDP